MWPCLVVGDVLEATTHTDIALRAKKLARTRSQRYRLRPVLGAVGQVRPAAGPPARGR